MSTPDTLRPGVGQRLAAFGIDAVLVALVFAMGDWLQHIYDPRPVDSLAFALVDTPLIPVLTGIFLAVGIVLCWVRLEGTPGALLMGIKVVDAESETAPRPGQALLRLLAYVPAIALFMLGLLAILWDREGRGWHDRWSRTRVIRDDDAHKSLDRLMHEGGLE